MATSLQDVLVCPISLQPFQDPVVAEDGHTYEREAITEWIRLNGTSPITRQPLTIEALRPNFILKQVIDQFETKIQEKKFNFKLNIDVRREKRALFQTFGKTIYKAEWIDRQQPSPPIIILKIDGARANKEASFYVDLSRHPHIVRTYGLVEDSTPNTSSVMLLQEYASEGSLFELLNDQIEVPAIEILEEMFIQIADAMIFLGKSNSQILCKYDRFSLIYCRFQKILKK
jgi:serine/threonine protein kinase